MRVFLALVLITMTTLSYAGTLTIKWVPGDGADGTKLYYATCDPIIPECNSTEVDVGNVTEYVIEGLDVGVTYFFRGKSYTASGESVFSYGAMGEAKLGAPTELQID